jgi:hypothetical protein
MPAVESWRVATTAHILIVTVGSFAVSEAAWSAKCGASNGACAVLLAQATAYPPLPPSTVPFPPASGDSPRPAPYGPVPESGGSTRSALLLLFATHFMPGFAAGLGDWFRNKLAGPPAAASGHSGENSTGPLTYGQPLPYAQPAPSGLPGTREEQLPQAQSAHPLTQFPNPTEAQVHAGIAYQVSLLGADGSRTLVDTARRTFATGERFEIAYRPNFPGVVDVYNIDPAGREERIDSVQLGVAQLATLGPYEFVNTKGNETLRIVLQPCLGSVADGQSAGNRGIARAQIRPEVVQALKACDDPARKRELAPTRGIARVSLEGGTSFALDPVSRSELESGRMAPREVVIRFVHN